jgi:hypothetical protein
MKSINHLSRDEQQNYMQCPHCKEYIDLHNLKNAVDHIVGKCLHTPPKVLYLKIIVANSFEEIIGDNVINLN